MIRSLFPILLSALGFALTSPASAESVTFVHTDALGSPIMESDINGGLTRQVDFRPYGLEVLDTAESGPAFTGHYRDVGTNLVYAQQRYYDPTIGTFLSVDPIPSDGTYGSNFNRYWYANNNPYLFVDPDGRLSLPMLADAISVEAGLEVGLNARLKVMSVVDVSVGTGSIRPFVLGSTLNDVYVVHGGSSFSLGVTVFDKFQVGWTPTEYRTERGRYDVDWIDTIKPGGWAFGTTYERQLTGRGGTATLDTEADGEESSVTGAMNLLLLKIRVRVNVGQALYSLKAEWGEEPAQKTNAEREFRDRHTRNPMGSRRN